MRVLFVTPWCLLDTTNGGAVSMRLLLKGLADSGVQCAAVNDALLTDIQAVGRDSLADVLRRQKLKGTRKSAGGFEYIAARDGKVAYAIADPTPVLRATPTAPELEGFLTLLEHQLETLKPDVVLTWPRDRVSEPHIQRLARQHGAAVVTNVLTADFKLLPEMVASSAMLLASSRFCAEVVAERVGVEPEVLYPIVPRERVATSRQGARYVTFVNPIPEKGLTVFLKIAERAQYELPDTHFLVVEGRWTHHVVGHVALPLEDFPNIRVLGTQADVRVVYAKTRVLLFPTLWRESFGMMIVEAQANGIPVIASNRGGVPEALNGAGVLLDPPRRCVENYGVIPNAREVRPWIRALGRLLGDADARRLASREARRAAEAFESDRIIPVARGFLERALPAKRKKSAG